MNEVQLLLAQLSRISRKWITLLFRSCKCTTNIPESIGYRVNSFLHIMSKRRVCENTGILDMELVENQLYEANEECELHHDIVITFIADVETHNSAEIIH
ncbi:hypothetical protein CDAR_211211 [Caerostris darwini]|uniref:Uncharacterized protein n=1 Tax=Caerostris darwini TaxID=1538125 RepID=A0AAV4T7A7_9ARAC|nr:hypothetical protein CDAR_211211 [Caerostris darwini]